MLRNLLDPIVLRIPVSLERLRQPLSAKHCMYCLKVACLAPHLWQDECHRCLILHTEVRDEVEFIHPEPAGYQFLFVQALEQTLAQRTIPSSRYWRLPVMEEASQALMEPPDAEPLAKETMLRNRCYGDLAEETLPTAPLFRKPC